MTSRAALDNAIERAGSALLHKQHGDGHWLFELEADATIPAEYVLLEHFLDRIDPQLEAKIGVYLRAIQGVHGGWPLFHDGPFDLSASVKAYFALKLAGHRPDEPFMQEARANILRLGGIPRMNTFSKLYLALLGQFPWKYLPTIPVEMVLLPTWMPFHIYKMSSWSRAMLIPLAIINHFKPTRELPGEKQLHELYPIGTEHKNFRLPRDERTWTWRNLFLRADDALKVLQEAPVCATIADHMLQGTTGAELAREMKKIKPNVPIILFSGTVPQSLNAVDVYVNKGEPTATFLGIVRTVVQRYRS